MKEGFIEWHDLLTAVRSGARLFYHAPMGREPARVMCRAYKNGKIRVRAAHCSFTAENHPEHLRRFSVETTNGPSDSDAVNPGYIDRCFKAAGFAISRDALDDGHPEPPAACWDFWCQTMDDATHEAGARMPFAEFRRCSDSFDI